ncbi:MAG: sigma-70 family RNA polymerase sigma factor [Candidatus Sericytochromatia bacterium]|nr:sigma-70 family RNA polymerase sigma factor [Candidatus Sericytochromatia bacterium]
MSDDPEQRRRWLRAAQRGDRDAFERLLAPLLPRLYSLAYHLTQHRDDAADVVQDSAVKAWRAIGGFREEADFSTWLARIVRNTVLDDVKRASRRHEEATETLPEAAVHVTEPRAERAELTALLGGYLADLSDKLREPLILYDLEGYSYEEIAEVLDLNLGTVKSRLNRARLALRERILASPDRLSGYMPDVLAVAARREG